MRDGRQGLYRPRHGDGWKKKLKTKIQEERKITKGNKKDEEKRKRNERKIK